MTNPLAPWQSALANVATAQARCYWIGDSLLEGTGASTRSKRTLDLMLAQLVSDHPVAGQGASQYLPAVYGCPTSGQATNTTWGGLWASSSSGTVTPELSGIEAMGGTPSSTFGLGQRSVDLSSTNATVTYSVFGTDLDVWFAAGGSFTYAVDGGTFSAAVNTSSYDANGQTFAVSLGSSGSHTISIHRSAGTVHLLGFTQFDGSRTKGIAMFDACHWSAQIKDFWDYTTGTHAQNAKLSRCVAVVAPQLVVINVLINDAGVIGQQGITECMARLNGILGAVQTAAPTASIAFCLPYDQVPDTQQLSDGHTIADLKTAVASFVSTNNLAFFDMTVMPKVYQDTTGLYQTDGEHMTDAGHALAASVLDTYIDAVIGVGSATVGAATAAGTGSSTTTATGASTVSGATAAGVATASASTSTAVGAATANAASAAGVGAVTAQASAAATVSPATASAVVASSATSGKGAATVGQAIASGVAKNTSAAAGAATAGQASASGAALVTAAGVGAGVAGSAAAAGAGTASSTTGSGAVTVSPAHVSAAAVSIAQGAGATTVSPVKASGFAGLAPSIGVGSATVAPASAAGVASVTSQGVANATVAPATGVGQASVATVAAGAATANATIAVGLATVSSTATAIGNATVAPARAAGIGFNVTLSYAIAQALGTTARGEAISGDTRPPVAVRTVVFDSENRVVVFDAENRTVVFTE